MEPIGLFAKGNVEDLVRVRIDDKLSRLKSGDDSIESDVDIVEDLIGYLILLRIIMAIYAVVIVNIVTVKKNEINRRRKETNALQD